MNPWPLKDWSLWYFRISPEMDLGCNLKYIWITLGLNSSKVPKFKNYKATKTLLLSTCIFSAAQQNFLYVWGSSQIPVFSILPHLTDFHSLILSVSDRPDSPSTYIKTRFLPSVMEAAIAFCSPTKGSFLSIIQTAKASLYLLLFHSLFIFVFSFLLLLQVTGLHIYLQTNQK